MDIYLYMQSFISQLPLVIEIRWSKLKNNNNNNKKMKKCENAILMKALKCTTLGGINQSTAYTVYGTVYTYVRTWIHARARATYHESVRYGIGYLY